MIPDEFSMPQRPGQGSRGDLRREIRSLVSNARRWLLGLGSLILLLVLGFLCMRFIDGSGIKAKVLADIAGACSHDAGGSSLLKKPRGDSAVSRSSIIVCEKLVRLKPADASAHVLLGNAYAEGGRTQEATASYQQALGLDPNCFDAYLGMGKVHFDQGAYAEAIVSYQKALKIRPRSASGHLSLGLALSNAGRYEEAMQAFQKAKELDPAAAETQILTGKAYFQAGMYVQAIESFKDAVRTDHAHAQAYFNLGRAYLRVGDRDLALDQQRILQNLDAQLADQLMALINGGPQDQNAI